MLDNFQPSFHALYSLDIDSQPALTEDLSSTIDFTTMSDLWYATEEYVEDYAQPGGAAAVVQMPYLNRQGLIDSTNNGQKTFIEWFDELRAATGGRMPPDRRYVRMQAAYTASIAKRRELLRQLQLGNRNTEFMVHQVVTNVGAHSVEIHFISAIPVPGYDTMQILPNTCYDYARGVLSAIGQQNPSSGLQYAQCYVYKTPFNPLAVMRAADLLPKTASIISPKLDDLHALRGWLERFVNVFDNNAANQDPAAFRAQLELQLGFMPGTYVRIDNLMNFLQGIFSGEAVPNTWILMLDLCVKFVY